MLCLDTIGQQSQGMPATLRHIPRGQDGPLWTGAVITDFKAKVEDAVEAAFIRELALPHRMLDPETAAIAAADYQHAMKAPATWEEHLVKAVYAFGSELKLDPKRQGTLRETAVDLFWSLLGSHGVTWKGRDYNTQKWDLADGINKALSAVNASLYALTAAVCHSMGFIPQLGFVHDAGTLPFIYDVADLYKHETSWPAAFQAISQDPRDDGTLARKLLKEKLEETRLLQRMTKDVPALFAD